MKKLGIFCTSAIDEVDNHCWNVVKIGNNYYHIDVTHDDPVCMVGEGTMSNLCGRDHLFLSDATMVELEQHSGGWYTVGGDFSCTDTSYENKIWTDYQHPSIYVDGAWYQVSSDGFKYVNGAPIYYPALLYKIDNKNNKTLYKTFDIPSRKDGNLYYSCSHDVFAVGDVIFGGGGNHIWRYSFSKDKFEVIFTTSENICEISYMGGGKIKVILNDGGTYSFARYDFLIGDSDDNGKVNATDMANLKKYLLTHSSDVNTGFMDLNGDRFVDILDFIAITKQMVQ